MYQCLVCMYVSASHACLVPMTVQRRHWNWDYRWLWAIIWVLGTDGLCSNHWEISVAPIALTGFKKIYTEGWEIWSMTQPLIFTSKNLTQSRAKPITIYHFSDHNNGFPQEGSSGISKIGEVVFSSCETSDKWPSSAGCHPVAGLVIESIICRKTAENKINKINDSIGHGSCRHRLFSNPQSLLLKRVQIEFPVSG